METLEARTGVAIPEGYQPDVSILRLTIDPVNVSIQEEKLMRRTQNCRTMLITGQEPASPAICSLEHYKRLAL
jgi:hypothetical protein